MNRRGFFATLLAAAGVRLEPLRSFKFQRITAVWEGAASSLRSPSRIASDFTKLYSRFERFKHGQIEPIKESDFQCPFRRVI